MTNLIHPLIQVDICDGHRENIQDIICFGDYLFLSVDNACCVIEWQYSNDCFDAYGRVLPKRYIVKGIFTFPSFLYPFFIYLSVSDIK